MTDSLQKSQPPVSCALGALVSLGRQKVAVELPGTDQCFDSSVWDMRSWRDRSSQRTNSNVYFTRYGTVDQPLPRHYADLIKGWIVLQRTKNWDQKINAARVL